MSWTTIICTSSGAIPTKDIRLLMDAEKNIDVIMKDGKIYKNTVK